MATPNAYLLVSPLSKGQHGRAQDAPPGQSPELAVKQRLGWCASPNKHHWTGAHWHRHDIKMRATTAYLLRGAGASATRGR
jgi:uncharacterized protein with PIN domain